MSYYQLPVVIDNGSGVIKAGLAGSREPQFVYSNIVGRAKGVEGAGSVRGRPSGAAGEAHFHQVPPSPGGQDRSGGRQENPEEGPRLEKRIKSEEVTRVSARQRYCKQRAQISGCCHIPKVNITCSSYLFEYIQIYKHRS